MLGRWKHRGRARRIEKKFSPLKVTIGDQEGPKLASAADGTKSSPVGMTLEPLTPDSRSQMTLGPETSGVLVAQVSAGSNADESGIQPGDVIERVGGSAVRTPSQVANAIHAAQRQKKQAIPLVVMRKGLTSHLGLKLEA